MPPSFLWSSLLLNVETRALSIKPITMRVDKAKKENLAMPSEQTLNFIEDYKAQKALWDSNDKHYINKNKRMKAYMMLATRHRMSVNGVKKKIKSLRSYYSKEIQKLTERAMKGEEYDSNWFAFKAMQFISESPKDLKSEVGSWTEEVNNADGPRTVEEVPDITDKESEDAPPQYFSQNQEAVWKMNTDIQQPIQEMRDHITENLSTCKLSAPTEMQSTSRKNHGREYIKNDLLNKKSSKKMTFNMVLDFINRLRDDHRVFGDFVASSLRDIKSDKLRRKLRLDIQKAILDATMLDHYEQYNDSA